MTVTFTVNVRKLISRQHQNLTAFSVENAENVQESCTLYELFCNSCRRNEKRKDNEKKRRKE
jgi:hypothetical protein